MSIVSAIVSPAPFSVPQMMQKSQGNGHGMQKQNRPGHTSPRPPRSSRFAAGWGRSGSTERRGQRSARSSTAGRHKQQRGEAARDRRGTAPYPLAWRPRAARPGPTTAVAAGPGRRPRRRGSRTGRETSWRGACRAWLSVLVGGWTAVRGETALRGGGETDEEAERAEAEGLPSEVLRRGDVVSRRFRDWFADSGRGWA